MLRSRLQLFCIPLAAAMEGMSSSSMAGGWRAICSTAGAQRMMREPLQPSRAPGAPEGGEKPDLVDKFLGPDMLPRREQNRLHRQEIIAGYERFRGDTGSTEVQVALLTQKIRDLAEHLQQHRKDYSSQRGLQAMLTQRRKLLTFLRRSKFDVYAALISRLGLKDTYSPQDRYSSRYRPADRRTKS